MNIKFQNEIKPISIFILVSLSIIMFFASPLNPSSLSIFSTERSIIADFTVSDLIFVTTLFAALLTIWVFYLKRRLISKA